MRFIIDASLLSISSHVSVAIIRIEISANARADRAALEALKANALTGFLARLPSGQNTDLEVVPSIKQWMQAYKAMSLKPKKIKPTHYALSLRLLKDKKWPRSIGPLVDTYLANQIKHLMPHGGYDVSALSGDTIVLRVSDEEHVFQPLGVTQRDEERMEKTKAGEVLYLDQTTTSSVTLTRYWNHRDAETTKIVDNAEDESKSSHDIVLFIESVDGSAEGMKRLEETANDLERAYRCVYGDDAVLQSFVRIVELTPEGIETSLDF